MVSKDENYTPDPWHTPGGLARAKALSKTQRKEIARKGGLARRANMTSDERKESARKAVQARWKRVKALKRAVKPE